MFNAAVGSARPCKALVADLHDIERRTSPQAELVARIAARLACAGDERTWLVDRFCKAQPQCYSQQLVYLAPDRAFSVVALTWGPGAQTSIHDHAGWCAVAVYEGVEEEKQYRLESDRHGRYLIETGSRSLELGRTVGIVADGNDIHRVGNFTRDVTISLHVYGVDIARTGSSIKSRFDALPVRA